MSLKCSICGSEEVIGFKVFSSARGVVGFVATDLRARCKNHVDD